MKRSVIILLVLIAFFAIPALAGTPQPENAPAPTSEDTMFLGWQLLSNEELLNIEGNAVPNGTSISNTTVIYIPQTNTSINLTNGTSVKHGTPGTGPSTPGSIPDEPSTPSTLTLALGEWGSGIGIDIAKMLME